MCVLFASALLKSSVPTFVLTNAIGLFGTIVSPTSVTPLSIYVMYVPFSFSHSTSFAFILVIPKSVTLFIVISYVFSSPFSAFTVMLNFCVSACVSIVAFAVFVVEYSFCPIFTVANSFCAFAVISTFCIVSGNSIV